ncbi:MAG TPA: helix-turn-helix transcriptional regulator [Candidatus Limnocylindrales bacterium]|nr:helix-turn-helix transcriptional regulator [Candidatus Limnocylindrales bacterium]
MAKKVTARKSEVGNPPRNALGMTASETLISLRKALNMTQQAFASEMKTAVTTVARWETNNPPPRGAALLRFAEVAEIHNLKGLPEQFHLLYAMEMMAPLKIKQLVVAGPSGRGYVLAKFDNRREMSAASEFLKRSAGHLEQIAKESSKG